MRFGPDGLNSPHAGMLAYCGKHTVFHLVYYLIYCLIYYLIYWLIYWLTSMSFGGFSLF